MITSRTQILLDRIETLAGISEDPQYLTRTFCSAAAARANACVVGWATESDLRAWVDNIGNVRIRHNDYDPSRPTFVIGSHLDSVIHAGKYDGPLGFLIGLAVLEHLVAEGLSLPFNLEVVGFSDEEGVRYHTTYLGSSVLAGVFEPGWLEKCDAQGITLGAAIEAFGGQVEGLVADAIPAGQLLGYYEVHIEQGPHLEACEVPVGVVSGIAGQLRLSVKFIGQAGHAGTVAMAHRYDALCAAADFIGKVEKYARRHKNLVATVGKCEVQPNASNVIPGAVLLSLDVRSADLAVLAAARRNLSNLAKQVAEKRRLGLEWELVQENPPVACDESLCAALAASVEAAGFPLITLPSGAGHDAVALAKVAPVSMLFVRCQGGISHHPDEYAAPEDIAAALVVSDQFIHQLIQSHLG